MPRPEVVIVIRGGLLVWVATPRKRLIYRLIHVDLRQVKDYEVADTGVDVEKFTQLFGLDES
jgi:hypothetical protein